MNPSSPEYGFLWSKAPRNISSGIPEGKARPPQTVVFGEVGLAGEVRAVTQPELRIAEAEKLGFKRCIIPAGSLKRIKKRGIRLEGVATVQETMNLIFES